MTDARIIRTRASLHRAIIELARRKPVPSITVSELAHQAGINRVTFYKHFSTPAETLGSALSVELDLARDRFIHGYEQLSGDPVEAFMQNVDQILDHVERHRDLYLLSVNTPQDGTVPNLLADHFTVTMTQYLAQRAGMEPRMPAFDTAIIARFFAHGLVGALKVWVLDGARDRHGFHRSVIQLAPEWWFPARD